LPDRPVQLATIPRSDSCCCGSRCLWRSWPPDITSSGSRTRGFLRVPPCTLEILGGFTLMQLCINSLYGQRARLLICAARSGRTRALTMSVIEVGDVRIIPCQLSGAFMTSVVSSLLMPWDPFHWVILHVGHIVLPQVVPMPDALRTFSGRCLGRRGLGGAILVLIFRRLQRSWKAVRIVLCQPLSATPVLSAHELLPVVVVLLNGGRVYIIPKVAACDYHANVVTHHQATVRSQGCAELCECRALTPAL